MSDVHLVFSCAVCRKVRDDQWDGANEQRWCTLVDLLRRRQVCETNVLLSECYCPDCALSYDRLTHYGRTELDALP
jgi:hypothetical protein